MEGLEGPEGTQGLGGSPPPLKALGDAGAEGLFLGGLSQTGRKSRQWLASRARVCFVSTLSYAFSKHLPSASGGAGSVFTAGDIPEWVQCYSSECSWSGAGVGGCGRDEFLGLLLWTQLELGGEAVSLAKASWRTLQLGFCSVDRS